MEKILDEIGLVARTLDGYVQHIYAVDQVEEQGTRTVLQKNFIERLYNDLQYLTIKLDEIYSMIGDKEVHHFPNADTVDEYYFNNVYIKPLKSDEYAQLSLEETKQAHRIMDKVGFELWSDYEVAESELTDYVLHQTFLQGFQEGYHYAKEGRFTWKK